MFYIVQQKQGIVKATHYINNVPINDDLQMEHKANHFSVHTIQAHNMQNSMPVVQRYSLIKDRGVVEVTDDYLKKCFRILELENLPDSYKERYKQLIVCVLTDETGGGLINSQTEQQLYEKVIQAGGGLYDSNDNTLYIIPTTTNGNSENYDKRTMLHELGHFKQFLQKDVQEDFSIEEMEKKLSRQNLLELHNIILHENLYNTKKDESPINALSSYEQDKPPTNVLSSYKQDDKGNYHRVIYKLGLSFNNKEFTLRAKQNLENSERLLVDEILEGLNNPIYNVKMMKKSTFTPDIKIRQLLMNTLIGQCSEYFEKC